MISGNPKESLANCGKVFKRFLHKENRGEN